MNALLIALLWCAVQIAVVSGVALLAARIVGRRNPAAAVWCLRTGVVFVLGTTLLMASPWPCWWSGALPSESAESGPVGAAVAAAEDESPSTEASFEQPNTSLERPGLVSTVRELFRDLSVAEEPVVPAAAVPASPRASRPSAATVLAWLCVVGIGIGLVRLVAGLVAVRRLRNRSVAVTGTAALEQRDLLQAELGCAQAVELGESPDLTTAATVGWRRPVVLLPQGWTSWSREELRAVLAHELAHIRSADFTACLMAQTGSLVHFYHPLVHWLTRRLRIVQELAADAAASQVAGGQRDYVTVLARLALREDNQNRATLGAAQAFLPAPRTLLRRVEMLRDSRELRTNVSRRLRALTAGVLIATTCLAAGLRAAGSAVTDEPETVNATPEPASATPASADESLSLAWVPNGAVAAICVRPQALSGHPALQPIASEITAVTTEFGTPWRSLERVTFCLPADGRRPHAPLLVLVSREPTDFAQVTERFGRSAQEKKYQGVTYKMSRSPMLGAFFQPDDRTLVMADSEQSLQLAIEAGPRGTTNSYWLKRWAQVEAKPAALLFDFGAFRDVPQGAVAPTMAAVAPIWEKSELATLVLEPGNDVALAGDISSISSSDAETVTETLKAFVVLGRNMIERQRRVTERMRGGDREPLRTVLELSDAVLQNIKITQADKHVMANVTLPSADVRRAVGAMSPALARARARVPRVSSMNNLKQIGLALHNYHDAYGHFPPAAGLGRDGKGKFPVSWRVLILPFVEETRMYEQYRFDEPWDSPHNSDVTSRIPAVFAHPDVPNDLNSAYFALVSTDQALRTGFGERSGQKIRNFTDGTSYSVLVVEAKRKVHWASPEDIVYNPNGDLPSFGGFFDDGFHAGMGDGSVHFFKQDADPETLRKLLTVNDGQVVDFERMRAGR